MLKYVFLACLLGLAGAGVIIQQQHQQEDEHLSYPKYKFHYSVHDEHTKDIKEQEESRDGDRVEGKYSLLQPDGYKRIVEYTADKHSGFNAVVRNEKDHREIQHEIQHEIENQSKHEIKIEHQHSGVYSLGSFAAGENHGFGKNEFSAGEISKIDFGKLEENKLESQHKFTAEELGKYGFSQFISSGGGSEVHKFDSKESSNQELKLQHPHGHSQIKFEIQHHEPRAKELISELHQFPKYESNIQHFHDQSDSEIKLEHYEPNRQIKFEHEINHQEPKLEGINWEQQGLKQEPKYEIKYEFKDEPKHEIKYEIKHELGLELSKPDGIKWEQQELNHKQQEEIKYEGVRWEQIFKQQPKLEELKWENRGLKQESKLGEIKWSYQPNYEAHIREDKRQEEANVVRHEINIKHIEPIKHEEYEQHAEQHHSFGHSEIKLQLHHRPTVQQEYKFESQKQPETSHVEESQTESPSFREEELKKLAESYSGGESEESSAGEASGYKYDKPAVKFELPSKQDW